MTPTNSLLQATRALLRVSNLRERSCRKGLLADGTGLGIFISGNSASQYRSTFSTSDILRLHFVEVSPGMFEHRKVLIASWSQVSYDRVVSGLKAGDRVVSGESLRVNALWHQAHGESF